MWKWKLVEESEVILEAEVHVPSTEYRCQVGNLTSVLYWMPGKVLQTVLDLYSPAQHHLGPVHSSA